MSIETAKRELADAEKALKDAEQAEAAAREALSKANAQLGEVEQHEQDVMARIDAALESDPMAELPAELAAELALCTPRVEQHRAHLIYLDSIRRASAKRACTRAKLDADSAKSALERAQQSVAEREYARELQLLRRDVEALGLLDADRIEWTQDGDLFAALDGRLRIETISGFDRGHRIWAYRAIVAGRKLQDQDSSIPVRLNGEVVFANEREAKAGSLSELQRMAYKGEWQVGIPDDAKRELVERYGTVEQRRRPRPTVTERKPMTVDDLPPPGQWPAERWAREHGVG